MAPAANGEGARGIDDRAHIVPRSRDVCERRGDVQQCESVGEPRERRGGVESGAGKIAEDGELARQRLVARAGDARVEVGEVRRGEASGAGETLPADEFASVRFFGESVRILRRDLHEVTEHAVMFDAQCPDAGARTKLGLKRGDDAAGVAGERSRSAQSGVETIGDEAAIACERRQRLAERGTQSEGEPFQRVVAGQ